jgi:hypothetical protein
VVVEGDDIGVVLPEFLPQQGVVVVERGDGRGSSVEVALEIGALTRLIRKSAL